MKKAKIAILGIAVLFAVLTVSTASAHVTVYFVPEDSSVPEGEGYSGYVEVWASVEDPDNLKAGQFAIHYDPSCINITEHPDQYAADRWGPCIDNGMSSWNANPDCWGPGYDMVWWSFAFAVPHAWCPSPQMIANFTVECVSSEYCLSNLAITCGEDCYYCPIEVLNSAIEHLYPDNTTLVNGTFTCGEALPDLTVTEKSEALADDGTFTVNYIVTNIGDGNAGASNTTIYIDGVNVLEDPVSALNASESYTNTVGPFNCPCNQTLNVTVCADNGNVVAESNETNNCLSNELKCLPCPGLPDLEITNVWCKIGSKRNTYDIFYSITNNGDANAPRSTSNLTIDGGRMKRDGVKPLAVGVTRTESFTYRSKTAPSTIKVCADFKGSIAESDETNNCLEVTEVTCTSP